LTRLPVAAFAAVVVATVGAFFVTQHLKVTTPLIAGTPSPFPSWINPVSGNTCYVPTANAPRYVSYRYTTISFYLLHRADNVDVWVVDSKGGIVATLATGRYMPVRDRTAFVWNGRAADGAFAPDGPYYVRVELLQQDRTLEISTNGGTPLPITIRTVPPHPVITRVDPDVIRRTGGLVTIGYAGNEHRGGTIRIYRTSSRGARLVKSFPTPWNGESVVWNGKINHRRARAGTYLIGLDVTDAACNTGHVVDRPAVTVL
jgi:hypothetical protein